MKWGTYVFVGRQRLSQFWCLQSFLHVHVLNTTPTCNSLCKFCTSGHKQRKTLLRSHVTQETLSNKNLTLRTIIDDKVEGTVTKQNDGVTSTEKKYIYPEKKLKLLAKLLHCSIKDVQALVSKYSFFTHLSPELINEKIIIMLFHGLPYSFISANPRLLYQTSATELKRRLQQFRDHSLLSENSVVSLDKLGHYLECKNKLFDWTFKRLCAERDALEGCYDQAAYMQLRLSVTKEQALHLLDSYPLKKHISNVKLKQILDFFLIETNLGAEYFINNRNLSMFSIVRLRTRWNVIVSEGVTSETKMLYIWNMSEETFKNIYANNFV